MKALLATLLLATTTSAIAQQPLQGFNHLPTLDKTLLISEAVLRAGDITTSHMAGTHPCHCFRERDPISPDGSQWAPLLAFQGAAAVGIWELHAILVRHHHTRWARAVVIADMLDEGYAVSHNAWGLKRVSEDKSLWR